MVNGVRRFIGAATGNTLLRRVGLLSSSVAVGQAITMLALLLTTRLFDPASFGLFSLFGGLAFLIGELSPLRYDLSIALARSGAAAAAGFALCVVLTLMVAGLAAIITILFGGALAQALGTPELASILPWLAPQVVISGLFLAVNQWSIRAEQFRKQATFQISRAAGIALFQLVAGLLVLGATGLVLGQMVGFGLALAWFAWSVLKGRWATLRRGFSPRRMRVVARRYRHLPLFSAPQDLLTQLSQNLPYFVLGALSSTQAVGLYWLAVRAMQMPLNFISQSMRQVYLRHISLQRAKGVSVRASVIKATAMLAVASVAVLVPTALWSSPVFGIVFGAVWADAGAYVPWVAVALLSALVKIPAWCVYHSMGRQREQFVIELFMFVAQNSALLILAVTVGPLAAIAAQSMIVLVFNSVFIYRAIAGLLSTEGLQRTKTRVR